MSVNFTDDDISRSIKLPLEAFGRMLVDDDLIVHLVSKKKDNPVVTSDGPDGKPRAYAIYGCKSPATKIALVNPYGDGSGDSDRRAWYQNALNANLSITMGRLLTKCVQVAIGANEQKKEEDKKSKSKSKKAAKGTEGVPDLDAMKYLSGIASEFDEKTLAELDSIISSNEIFIIYYHRRDRVANVSCTLFNKARRDTFPKVRDKTWKALQKLVLNLLDVEDISDFSTSVPVAEIPAFSSTYSLYVTLVKALQEPCKMLGLNIDTVEEMEQHRNMLELYYERARHTMSSVLVRGEPETADAPWKLTNGGQQPSAQPESLTKMELENVAPWRRAAPPVVAPQCSAPAVAPVAAQPVQMVTAATADDSSVAPWRRGAATAVAQQPPVQQAPVYQQPVVTGDNSVAPWRR